MSLKHNFFFSTILTISGYIFQLITYPYVSRVLGVTNIGICNFVDSIINYFVMFAAMGIATIGIREISAFKDDEDKRNSIYSSLIVIHGILTLVAIVLLTICIYAIPQFEAYKQFFYIGLLKLIGSLFLIEWFYKGMENFKQITKFSLLVKFLYVIAIFVLVKNHEDVNVYYLLCILMTSLNAAFNFVYARKYIHFDGHKIEIKKYLKPNIIYGSYFIIGSLYTSFNVMYLGLVAGVTQVGYYATANKIITLVIMFFSAFTNVMLPRMSAIIHEKKYKDFVSMINKSVGLLLAFSIPVIIVLAVFSPDVILLISGKGYEGAVIPACIMMPLILIIGYEQILVVQIQMPLKLDSSIMLNSIIGAIVGILLNITIVSKMMATGSAVVWLCSELSVLITAQILVSKSTSVKFPYKLFFEYIVAYLPLLVVIYFISIEMEDYQITRLFAGTLIAILYSVLIQVLYLKNEIILNLYVNLIKLLK